MKSGQGFLFFAEGDRYIKQAERAAQSLRDINPQANITISSNSDTNHISGFDRHLTITYDSVRHPKVGKIRAIRESPYLQTIFCDTDVVFADDVHSVFDALAMFPIIATHAPFRPIRAGRLNGWPECLPQLNTGFVGLNFSDQAITHFVGEWERHFSENLAHSRWDQDAFNYTLYKSNIRFLVLPVEYNFRAEFSHQSKGRHWGVKVIHSHHINEMEPQKSRKIIEQLAQKEMATLFKKGTEYFVETREIPSFMAVRNVAQRLRSESPINTLATTDYWQQAVAKANLFVGCVNELERLLTEIHMVQIGANDGSNDKLASFINRPSWRSVLVEPQPDVFPDLAERYSQRSNVRLVEAAVASADGTITLRRPIAASNPANATSARRASRRASIAGDRGHVSRLRPDEIEEFEVRSVCWRTLTRETGTERIDVLCLDTEGAELSLLEAFLLSHERGEVPKPTLIHYEERHLFPFERARLKKLLRDRGYRVVEGDFPQDTTAVDMARVKQLRRKS